MLQTPAAPRVNRLIFAANETLHAPHLIDLEIAQALRRYALSGVISPGRGSEAITDLANFPLTRYPHLVLLPRVWQMRQNLTAYDSVYLALSEALGATLVTRDRALGQFRTPVHVEVV